MQHRAYFLFPELAVTATLSIPLGSCAFNAASIEQLLQRLFPSNSLALLLSLLRGY